MSLRSTLAAAAALGISLFVLATESLGQAPPPSGAVVWDTFTAPNGTLIQNRPVDLAPSGSAWLYIGAGSSGVRIQGNRVEQTGTGTGHQPWVLETGRANAAVAADFIPGEGKLGSIVLRATSASNY